MHLTSRETIALTTPAFEPATPIEGVVPWLETALAVLFVICVPLCLVANNVRFVTLDPSTYRDGFGRYRAAENTGLDNEQLTAIARAFIDYFQAPPGRLEPVVRLGGSRRPLFNEREVAHMEDVQRLMQLVFRLGLLAGGYLLVFVVALVVVQRQAGLAVLGRLTLSGSGLSIAVLVVVAALSSIDFGELFIRFHQLSFRNDLWQLDPEHDYLLMLFPERFWLDVTLRIASLTAVEALGVGALGFLLARQR